MGPGHGESAVVHLGRGDWMIVDSCVEAAADGKRSAPLKYLRSIGVSVEHAVKLVVATHWDDDHVRGIAEVVAACNAARFCCSPAITQRDFVAFVEAKSIGATATDGANVRDMRRLFEILRAQGKPMTRAAPARTLIARPHVRSWSPADKENDLFLHYIASKFPKHGETMSKAVPGSPNLTSIVLSVDWEDASALLGADMETHSDQNRGWGAVVAEAAHVGFTKGNLVKIPHHGSHTGHDPRMWSEMLVDKPMSVIAPFGKGAVEKRPPKPSDIHRVSTHSSRLFLTATHAKPALPKRDYAVVRSLRESRIRTVSRKSPLGIVRMRRTPGANWEPSLFGPARQVK